MRISPRNFSLMAVAAMLGMSKKDGHFSRQTVEDVSGLQNLATTQVSQKKRRPATRFWNLKYRGRFLSLPTFPAQSYRTGCIGAASKSNQGFRHHPLAGLRKVDAQGRPIPVELDAQYRQIKNALKRERRAARA